MPLTADRKVSLFTIAIAIVASALTWGLTAGAGMEPAVESPLEWWYFIPVFALMEWAVVHIEVRRESYSLSMSEPVSVIALFFLGPLGLICARLAGTIVALRARKLPAEKRAFNLAMIWLQTALPVYVFHVLLLPRIDGQLLWASGTALVLASAAVGDLLVATVISFYDRDRPAKLIASAIRSNLTMTMATTSMALLGLAAVVTYPITSVALAIVILGFTVLIREQAATVKRASNLNLISDFTTTLTGLSRTSDILQVLVDQSVDILRGSRGAVIIESGPDLDADGYQFDIAGPRSVLLPSSIRTAVEGLDKPRLLRRLCTSAGIPLHTDGVAAPLRIGDSSAVVVVWGRSTSVGNFSEGDLQLLAALVAQTEIAAQRSILGDQLALAAHHDSLTGLANRLGFDVAFEEAGPTKGALLVLDLNRFKDLNDTLGHPTGDQALCIISKRLARISRTSALIGRLGGDEFALFDPSIDDTAAAAALAKRVIEVIEEPIHLMQLALHVGASVGIAMMPTDGSDLTGLFSHADVAMYAAKERQSGWEFYRNEDDTNSPRRLELLAGLRPAIERGELEVWYQPKVRASDEKVVGLEALARWQHPRFGFVPPDEFIALAEGAGMMRDLTDFVLSRSMQDAAKRLANGHFLPVAVNLSTRNLLDDTLAARMEELLAKHGIGPELISFEVTETAVMLDRQRVIQVLEEIKSIGFHIAVDDYGTGYSSLAYLRDLPVDELKIDRVFITDVDVDPSNLKIVQSTIELAHGLGLDVVAEGVERPGEFDALRALGCDLIQGYYFSRPLADPLLDRFLAEYAPGVLDVADASPKSANFGE